MRDICICLLGWDTPLPMEAEPLATDLLEQLMKHVSHARRFILANNLELIKLLGRAPPVSYPARAAQW